MDCAGERLARGRARWLAGTATACSATLFFFGTGLAPVPWLTWLAPLPVLLLAPRVSTGTALSAAFVAYLAGSTNSWHFFWRSHDVPLLPWGLLISIGTALMFVLAGWLFRALLRRGRALLAATAAPAVWVGLLYLVSIWSPRGVVGTLATTQADVPVVLQTAAVTGAWGVEYLVLLAPSALAALLSPAVPAAARVRTATVAVVALAAALVGGTLRLAGESGAGQRQRVALIASNTAGWAADLRTAAGRNLVAAYADRVAALPEGVRTVVLPEEAFGSDQAAPAALVDPISRVARARGVDVVVGFARSTPTEKDNVALVFPARGGAPTAYLKHHDMVGPPGHDLVFAPVAGVRTGVEICADVDFRDPSRDYARAGGRLLVIPASDEGVNGWQHSRTALLRGVENGEAVAWGGRQSNLMVADGRGRVLTDVPTGGTGPFTTAVADVPAGRGATPYARMGDWFAWLCVALAVAGSLAARTPSWGFTGRRRPYRVR
jgi:apolipoprotein N-acyltransferase